jgi:hypothetical protein
MIGLAAFYITAVSPSRKMAFLTARKHTWNWLVLGIKWGKLPLSAMKYHNQFLPNVAQWKDT